MPNSWKMTPQKMPLVVPSPCFIRRVNVVGVIDGFHAPLFMLTLWLTPSCKWVSRSPTRSPFLPHCLVPPFILWGACQGPPGDQTQDAHPIALCIHPEEQYDAEYDLYCIATYIHILHLHSGFVTCYYHFSKWFSW